MWERMAASEIGKGKGDSSRTKGVFFGEARNGGRKCYGCGVEGHIQRFCPKKKCNEMINQVNLLVCIP